MDNNEFLEKLDDKFGELQKNKAKNLKEVAELLQTFTIKIKFPSINGLILTACSFVSPLSLNSFHPSMV